MKRLILTISVILFFVSPAYAWMGVTMVGGGGGAAAGCAYTYCETFDASGYDLGACGSAPCWTETLNEGTVNEDYTGTGTISGQSLLLDENGTGSPETVLTLTSAASNVYFRANLYSTKLATGSAAMVSFYDADDVLLVSFLVDGNEYWSVNTTDSADDPQWVDDTTFTGCVWFEYEKGTSNDGVGRIYASSDCGVKGDVKVSRGNLAEELDVKKIKLFVTDSASNVNVFDNVYISTVGSIP